MHTMQAALALSPTNKAKTTLPNGDTFLLQEYAHEKYRMWIVAPGDIPVWSGLLYEDDLNTLHEKYGVQSGQVWEPLGIMVLIPLSVSEEIIEVHKDYKAILEALLALADHLLNLRTELLVIKAMLAKSEAEDER